MDYTGLNWVILDYSGFYGTEWTILDCMEVYWIPNDTGLDWIKLDYTELFWIIPDYRVFHKKGVTVFLTFLSP